MPNFSFKGGTHQESSANGGIHKFMCFLIGNKKEIPSWEAQSQGLIKIKGTEYISSTEPDSWYSQTMPVFDTSFTVVKVMIYHKWSNRMPFSYSFFFFMAPTGKEYIIRPYDDGVTDVCGWRFKAEGRFLRTPELKTVVDQKTLTYRLAITQGLPSKDVIRKIISVKELQKKEEACGVMSGKRFIRQRGLTIDPEKKGE